MPVHKVLLHASDTVDTVAASTPARRAFRSRLPDDPLSRLQGKILGDPPIEPAGGTGEFFFEVIVNSMQEELSLGPLRAF